jgi:hypothetical protein
VESCRGGNRGVGSRIRHKSNGAGRPAGRRAVRAQPRSSHRQAVINGVLRDLRLFTQYFRRQRIITRFR